MISICYNIFFKKLFKLKRLLLLIPCVITMSACSSMNDQFDCPIKSHSQCMPIQEANRLVDQGQFNKVESPSNKILNKRKNNQFMLQAPLPGEPVRYGETVQQIWIAPFEDQAGDYHEPSIIYTILSNSAWIGIPAKAIVSEDE